MKNKKKKVAVAKTAIDPIVKKTIVFCRREKNAVKVKYSELINEFKSHYRDFVIQEITCLKSELITKIKNLASDLAFDHRNIIFWGNSPEILNEDEIKEDLCERFLDREFESNENGSISVTPCAYWWGNDGTWRKCSMATFAESCEDFSSK